MNNYIFQFIIFLFVHFTQIQCTSTEIYVSFGSTMGTATMVPDATSPSSPASTIISTATMVPDATSPSSSASTVISTATLAPTAMSPSSSASTVISTATMGPTATSPSSSASTVISTATMVPNATSPSSSASTVISTLTSNEPNGTSSLSVTSLETMSSPTNASSMGTNASTEHFTSQFMSTHYSTMTSESININISLIYKYNVESSSQLKLGQTTDPTVLASVQMIVRSSFNLPGFTITVISVEIRSQAKISINEMFTNNLFTSSRSNCDETCIKNSRLSSIPPGEFTLQAADGSLVNASAKSAPLLVQTSDASTVTTTTVNYQKGGESPPGLAGQLGMGLGITSFAIVVIVLIVYLYRKYGFNNPRRPSDYELTTYHHRLSV